MGGHVRFLRREGQKDEARRLWRADLKVRGADLGPRFSKKGPVIGGRSQSREKTQRKSIRGSVMCRNSHMRREMLLQPRWVRDSLAVMLPADQGQRGVWLRWA
jgi:hypothetical protein